MRIVQPKGTKGSLKWIQAAIEHYPDILQPPELPTIEWVSPLAMDDYAEYRDAAFLNLIKLPALGAALKTFWPQRGPQWDALGLTSQGPVLVEAKAHIREFYSPPSQAGQKSREKIGRAFGLVQEDLGIQNPPDWTETYYQYANRLALLWWLRSQRIDAKLLFVSFINDTQMLGPEDKAAWDTAFAQANAALGLPKMHKLSAHIFHISPDVRKIASILE
jgi:hypothetical protein